MSDYSMADISSLLQSMGSTNGMTAINSTSRKNNTDLDMTDFLQLMIVQLQSQTMDDTMDTSEMMNQLVQMQMVTAITNMTETNIMTYASSLVGKEVTIGVVKDGNLEERVVNIIGTGYSAGQQVLFGDDGETYALNQIMAVGRLPEIEGVTKPGEGDGSTGGSGSTGGTGGTGGSTDTEGTGGTDGTGDGADTDGTGGVDDTTNKPVENPDQTETDENNGGEEEKDPAVSPSEGVG